MTEQDDSHYKTYPQGFSKKDVYLLKKQAFLLGKKRLDPTQEIDEGNETDEAKLEHHRPSSVIVTSKEIQTAAESAKGPTAAASSASPTASQSSSAADVSRRTRRNSEEGGRAATAAAGDESAPNVAAGGGGGQRLGGRGGKPRSSVKHFFESFRPRARSENPSSMMTASGSGGKRRANSGGGGAGADGSSASSLPDSSGGGGGGVGGGAGPDALGAKKRSQSPMGSLVTRLRNLASETGEWKRRGVGGSGVPPVLGLPHPSDIPLDAAYLEQHTMSLDRQEERRNRLRKNSYPPNPISVQLRHKDLFENLSHATDLDGQCCIQSATAMAESSRPRRMSGPSGASSGGATGGSAFAASQQQQQPQHHQGDHPRSTEHAAVSRSRTLPPSSGGQGIQVTENEKYIIFRSKCMSDSAGVDMEEVRQATVSDPSRVFATFAQKHRCYDLIPTSSKLLVFDHKLNVKKAFFALVYNGLRAAPVWDSEQQRFVGMLTITDFINILNHFYRSALVPMEELESHRISTWRAQLPDSLRPFLWISPEASLLDAVRLLLHARVHRLPVVEPRTGNALFILTHKRILKFIYLYMHQLPMPEWMDATLQQLGIGTYTGIRTISDSTPLVKVLSLFVQHRVSALPIVGPDGRLTDIYSKFDVINLAATKTYNNLDVSVREALHYRRDRFEGVTACRPWDSLRSVLEKLVTAEVHRLVIVDQEERVIGVVSLSDVLKAIVLDYEVLAASLASAPVASANSAATAAAGAEPMETG